MNGTPEKIGEHSDLREIDLEQATEVGFLTVEGTDAWNDNELPINATRR